MSIELRMRTLLELIAEDKRLCKGCHELLFFVRHRNGRLTPYTEAGLNHFIDCPYAKKFKRPTTKEGGSEESPEQSSRAQ